MAPGAGGERGQRTVTSPGAGGAASKGPMIEKRSRAHRSRCGGSVGVFKRTPGSGAPGWWRHWECRLRSLGSVAICILCGNSTPLGQRDRAHRERRQKAQQPLQRLGGLAGKAREQLARQPLGRHRGHEAGAQRLP